MSIDIVRQLGTENITAVTVRPKDVLVFLSDVALTDRAVASLKDELKPLLPEGVKILVIENGRFAVIRPQEETA